MYELLSRDWQWMFLANQYIVFKKQNCKIANNDSRPSKTKPLKVLAANLIHEQTKILTQRQCTFLKLKKGQVDNFNQEMID